MAKEPAPAKVLSLHYLRGLAALLVAFGHAAWFPFDAKTQIQYLGSPLSQLGSPSQFPVEFYKITTTGMFPVACFFLLSGYVLEFSLKEGAFSFLINRIFRIYPVLCRAFSYFLHWLTLLLPKAWLIRQ